LLTMKSYNTKQSCKELSEIFKSTCNDYNFLTMQNGIGNEETISSFFGEENSFSGALTISVSLIAPGRVRQNTIKGSIGLASLIVKNKTKKMVVKLKEIFENAEFKTVVFKNYRELKWSKLLLNISVNK
ncbi:unnamed protein product, partial [marine sediment metagenome]